MGRPYTLNPILRVEDSGFSNAASFWNAWAGKDLFQNGSLGRRIARIIKEVVEGSSSKCHVVDVGFGPREV